MEAFFKKGDEKNDPIMSLRGVFDEVISVSRNPGDCFTGLAMTIE
jgi:hypothetical protein